MKEILIALIIFISFVSGICMWQIMRVSRLPPMQQTDEYRLKTVKPRDKSKTYTIDGKYWSLAFCKGNNTVTHILSGIEFRACSNGEPGEVSDSQGNQFTATSTSVTSFQVLTRADYPRVIPHPSSKIITHSESKLIVVLYGGGSNEIYNLMFAPAH